MNISARRNCRKSKERHASQADTGCTRSNSTVGVCIEHGQECRLRTTTDEGSKVARLDAAKWREGRRWPGGRPPSTSPAKKSGCCRGAWVRLRGGGARCFEFPPGRFVPAGRALQRQPRRLIVNQDVVPGHPAAELARSPGCPMDKLPQPLTGRVGRAALKLEHHAGIRQHVSPRCFSLHRSHDTSFSLTRSIDLRPRPLCYTSGHGVGVMSLSNRDGAGSGGAGRRP